MKIGKKQKMAFFLVSNIYFNFAGSIHLDKKCEVEFLKRTFYTDVHDY